MKAVRNTITEYDLELPKAIKAFKYQLLGLQSSQSRNNDSDIDNKLDVPSLPPVDSGEEENDQYMSPLNP